jgi:hypothetical protein
MVAAQERRLLGQGPQLAEYLADFSHNTPSGRFSDLYKQPPSKAAATPTLPLQA